MKRVILILCLFFFFSGALHAEEQKRIGIMLYKVYGSIPWDPETVKKGITGSEEAVIYISKELAKLGYKVIVYGDPPKGSLHSMPGANPRYVNVNAPDEEKLDIAISWRMPGQASELKKLAGKVFLWPHDTYHAKLREEQVNGFDDVLWLSEWQRAQWISINPSFAKFTKIFGNGIVPAQFKKVKERANPYSCIYGSNYARGLDVLLDAWPNVKKQFPLATLDIYYGWQHWGLLTPEKESKLRQKVTELQPLGVQEHGLVSHEKLNKAYAKASFWTYPCTAPEVFCITAIRAQLAGAVPVIIQGTGLYETVRHGYGCKTAQEYENTLIQAMKNAEKITLEQRKEMGNFVLENYTWEKVARKWKELFDSYDLPVTEPVTGAEELTVPSISPLSH